MIVFGRFFCGFACAFGTLGDFFHEFYVWICKKVKRKSVGISDSINKRLSVIKYFILTIIILLCLAGVYSGIKEWRYVRGFLQTFMSYGSSVFNSSRTAAFFYK